MSSTTPSSPGGASAEKGVPPRDDPTFEVCPWPPRRSTTGSPDSASSGSSAAPSCRGHRRSSAPAALTAPSSWTTRASATALAAAPLRQTAPATQGAPRGRGARGRRHRGRSPAGLEGVRHVKLEPLGSRLPRLPCPSPPGPSAPAVAAKPPAPDSADLAGSTPGHSTRRREDRGRTSTTPSSPGGGPQPGWTSAGAAQTRPRGAVRRRTSRAPT